MKIYEQCCGVGSWIGIRCLFHSWIRDPGRIKNRIRIRDEQPESYFRELRNLFLGLKYLICLMRIQDPESRMGQIRIRDGKQSDLGFGITSRIRNTGYEEQSICTDRCEQKYYVNKRKHPTKLYYLVAGKTNLVLRTEPTLGEFVEVDMKTFQSVHSPGAKN